MTAPAWTALTPHSPRVHQIHGVEWLTTDADPAHGRVYPRCHFLGDEVGAGKSKQIVDASDLLYTQQVIDTVVTVSPAAAVPVWADLDPVMGEVTKHSWSSVDYTIRPYTVLDNRLPKLAPRGLLWISTNYEFIRRDARLLPLLNFLSGRRFSLVCDEAWALKDDHTDQWKATFEIRKLAQRITMLNGTPVVETPLDLFGQFKMLDWRILGFRYFSHYRARYAMLKPNVSFPMVIGYQNLEELRAKAGPYIIRRLTRDCFDLPPVLDPESVFVPMTPQSWDKYCQMRDELVVWLTTRDASIANHAMIKSLRLAQLTSGFLGGVVESDLIEDPDDSRLAAPAEAQVVITGREKIDGLLRELERRVPPRVLVWCFFRQDVERVSDELTAAGWNAYRLYGSQTKTDRQAALRALNPDVEAPPRTAVVGNPRAGGAAVNLSGAALAITYSPDPSLRVYLQARGRIDRPGQRNKVGYVDLVATGPKGQKTINHHVLSALRTKDDVAKWTAATWRQKLLQE